MLPRDVYLVEEMQRQYRDRIQKEAENARILHNLVVRQPETRVSPPKKPVILLQWLQQLRAQ
jgi:hypothetical protein